MPNYSALSLGCAYINNFLEGLKDSIMIMHPSTRSSFFFFHSLSPPIPASSASRRAFVLYSELPLS
jgi:hypothetical protein